MARFDRIAEEYRDRAMRYPMTQANRLVVPQIEMGAGVYIGLSLNK